MRSHTLVVGSLQPARYAANDIDAGSARPCERFDRSMHISAGHGLRVLRPSAPTRELSGSVLRPLQLDVGLPRMEV